MPAQLYRDNIELKATRSQSAFELNSMFGLDTVATANVAQVRSVCAW
jgi:hypothetical protein